ncbi:YfhH family protein [Chryseomicrobium sp. FSL W7-1435]|uniref:YfhH family protein n=1 Tax=Chryseomicrobium sp. FSL W7-1435 TaxID=2921704 RepID=UPI003159FC64
MDKKYSQMTQAELRQEIANLKEKARKAEQLGIVNEFAVYERKAKMAQAYLIDPKTIVPGELYKIEGDPGVYFKVDYLKGRFAWGHRLGGERFEEALPISMLEAVK